MNRSILAAFLAPAKAELFFARDGAEAVAAAERRPFDLILMDIEMPGVDGLAATALIRRREREKRLPPARIVALTANAMTHQVDRYLAAGMNGHLAKPLSQGGLLRLLAETAKTLPARGDRSAA